MNRIRVGLLRSLATLLLAVLPAAPAWTQALPPGMTMHRIQAGEPDASGWVLAASTAGGYSVRMPFQFNDFTMAVSDPGSATSRVFTVGATSQEGVKFVASRAVYRKGTESAKHFFSRFGQDFVPPPERIVRGTAGGRPVVDVSLRNASAVSYQRAVLLESDMVLLVVESPIQHDALVQKLAATFFDSLVVDVK